MWSRQVVVITHVGDLARISFPCPLSISYIKECHLIIPVLNPHKTPSHKSDRVLPISLPFLFFFLKKIESSSSFAPSSI
ncbi:hypothetical protein V8C42DRAFT_37312 [Trichoderma barbatum]